MELTALEQRFRQVRVLRGNTRQVPAAQDGTNQLIATSNFQCDVNLGVDRHFLANFSPPEPSGKMLLREQRTQSRLNGAIWDNRENWRK